MHVLALIILLCCYRTCWSVCSYPSELIGDWYSTSFGTLNFVSNQSFTGFTSALSATPLTFTCHESSGNTYVSLSTYTLFTTFTSDVYLCMNLVQISAIKFYFTLDNNLDTGTGLRFYSPANSGDAVTLATACNRTDTRTAGEYELLIKQDQLSNAVVTCPTSLQSTFNVTMTTESVDSCEGTVLEGSSGSMVFNYTSCVTGHFNSGGYLQCLYSLSDTYTYVTLYNNDTTIGTSTYRFTCLVYEKHDATLRATESPSSCHKSQSPTAVDTPGITYVMSDLLYTPEKKDYTVVIIVVCCIAGAIIITVIVIVVYCKICKSKPEPPKVRTLKRKLSVTEYTPRSLGRGSSVETITESRVHKQSTGEIITGVLVDKKLKHALQNGDAYEPPKKEAWQKKWEADKSKVSPRLTQESLNRLKTSYTSDGEITGIEKLSVSDLDKAYTMSTSLPESLDIVVKQSPRQNTSSTTKEKDTTLINTKYSDRSHASPSMPASTGKFGGSPKIRSIESLLPPVTEPTLDTICENPLSRENTSAVILQRKSATKPLIEHPNITRNVNSDVASLSTFRTSLSTASVGDVRLQNSFQTLSSRNSHLSASNASIFDDPDWLMENKKALGDKQFESIKNLLPSLPKEKEKDIKWFIKSQKKPEISREDIDYFKSKNKSYVGLNSSIRHGSSNSLEIIQREKMRRKHKKNKKASPKLIRPVSPHFED